jgi:hypothetical protein
MRHLERNVANYKYLWKTIGHHLGGGIQLHRGSSSSFASLQDDVLTAEMSPLDRAIYVIKKKCMTYFTVVHQKNTSPAEFGNIAT